MVPRPPRVFGVRRTERPGRPRLRRAARTRGPARPPPLRCVEAARRGRTHTRLCPPSSGVAPDRKQGALPPSWRQNPSSCGRLAAVRPLQKPRSVNNRVVLIGAEQDFFLDLLEMLVPGGAEDPLLSLDDFAPGQLPPPAAGPFEVWFVGSDLDGLNEVRRMRASGEAPAVAFLNVAGVEDSVLPHADRLLSEDPRLQVVLVVPLSSEDWEARAAALGHRDQVVVLKRPFDAIEARELAHQLVERWNQFDRVLSRLPLPLHVAEPVRATAPLGSSDNRVAVLKDAFRAIRGLVEALSVQCAELETQASRAAELEEAGNTFDVVARALAGLRRMESLVERDGSPVDLHRLPQA
jgi:two-component system, NtrC family, sensor kinase